MVKGSDKLGLLNQLDKDGYCTGGCLETRYWEEHPSRVISFIPEAGGISIHHGLT